MTRGVRRLLMDEDERLAGVELLRRELEPPPHVINRVLGLRRCNFLEPNGERKPAQERRLADERPGDTVPLEERRPRMLAPVPLERDHGELLAVQPAQHLAR